MGVAGVLDMDGEDLTQHLMLVVCFSLILPIHVVRGRIYQSSQVRVLTDTDREDSRMSILFHLLPLSGVSLQPK